MDILIIDPDAGMQEYYNELFLSQFNNLGIAFVNSAESALASMESHPFDLVISESRLPDMNILELIEKMIAKKLPIILVSSDTSRRLIVETIRAGALDFVPKSSLKNEILVPVLKRAFLEADRWMKIQHYSATLPHRPEYEKIDQFFSSFIVQETFEKKRELLSRGMMRSSLSSLNEGESCLIVYLYFQIVFPESLINGSFEKNFIEKVVQKTMQSVITVPERYGGSLWIRKEDAAFFAFPEEGMLSAALAAMEIYSAIQLVNRTTERLSDPIVLKTGISSGQTIYHANHELIYSEALNLAAHLAIRQDRTENGIWVTPEIYENLGPRAKKYFKNDGLFESHSVYTYLMSPESRSEA